MKIYGYDATFECLENAECRWKLHKYRGKGKIIIWYVDFFHMVIIPQNYDAKQFGVLCVLQYCISLLVLPPDRLEDIYIIVK